MKKYIGVKLVDAKPMTKNEFNRLSAGETTVTIHPDLDGYLVEYMDGYKSWCPKDVFERQNFELSDFTDDPYIDDADVVRFMSGSESGTVSEDKRNTDMCYKLRNGQRIYESWHCNNPINFADDVGVKICHERATERVLELLEFLLKCAKNGFRNS